MPTDRSIAVARRRPARGDDGFTVAEMIVAIAVIGTVMAALAPFLARTMVVVAAQRGSQAGVEVVNDALERARGLDPASLLSGRGPEAVRAQWATAPDAVKAFEPLLAPAGDPMLPDDSVAGERAPLPTTPRTVTLTGLDYRQSWYVGRCYQPKATPRKATERVDDCRAAQPTGTTVVTYLRVVAAVTWKQSGCAGDVCVRVGSTLVSTGADQVFDLKATPPTVEQPADRYDYTGVAVTPLQFSASGGSLPRTWSADGLPPGLSVAADSGLVTGTPTTAGTYPVSVTMSDGGGQADDVAFTWYVAAPLTLTAPAAQNFRTTIAASLPVVSTGGHAPLTWTATGLPAGLSIGTTTGVISGTAPTAQTTWQPVTVTAVDAAGTKVTTTFQRRVLPTLTLPQPTDRTFASGSDASQFQLPKSGGFGPFVWTTSGLPDGYTMDKATGRISGVVTNGTRYVVRITVTDSVGGPGGFAQVRVIGNVTPRPGELYVKAPLPDRSSRVGAAVTATATADGGTGTGYAWTASGLPAGVTFGKDGALAGRPTTPGEYDVTLTVTDSAGARARSMFTWTVTP